MTITQTIEVPDSRRLIIDVPPQTPTGASVIIQFPVREEASSKKERKSGSIFDQPSWRDMKAPNITPVRGCAKGQFWMADDFDEPLEDFKDYM